MVSPGDSGGFFYSVIASDENDSFFGLDLDLERCATKYVSFREDFGAFEVAHCHAIAVHAGAGRVAFFDYSGCVYGVVDAAEGRILWARRIKSPGNLKCLWAEGCERILKVQLGRSVSTLDVSTGAEISVEPVKGDFHAAGIDYSVVSDGKRVAIQTRDKELQFKSVNGIRKVRRFGRHLGMIEWQGPARVIDCESGCMVFEAEPERKSQFSDLHYIHGGEVVLTQHFFDEPNLTDVRTYPDAASGNWIDATIAMAGNHVILGNGREIAYATRGFYDPKTGTKVGVF